MPGLAQRRRLVLGLAFIARGGFFLEMRLVCLARIITLHERGNRFLRHSLQAQPFGHQGGQPVERDAVRGIGLAYSQSDRAMKLAKGASCRMRGSVCANRPELASKSQ